MGTVAQVIIETYCAAIVVSLLLLAAGRLVMGDWEWFVQDDSNDEPRVPADVDLAQALATTRAIDEAGRR